MARVSARRISNDGLTPSAVDIDDIKKLNAYQCTVSGAIAVDKSRLLRDESTSNINLQVLIEIAEVLRRRDQPHKYDSLPTLPDLPVA